MFNFRALLVAGAFTMIATAANAEVTGLKAKFGAGGNLSNHGSVIIRVAASGADLANSDVQLKGGSSKSDLKLISKRSKSLSSTGHATFRVLNEHAAWQVVTANNGNDQKDHKSNVLVEK